MGEMVDRVATAIEQASQAGMQPFTDSAREYLMPHFRSLARAAIEAMREPTEVMTEAPRKALISAGDYTMNGHEAGEAWRTMIDEALK